MNTNIEWRVTVVCNFVIFLVLTRFCEVITVKAANWRCDDKQEKQPKKDYCEASDSVLEIGCLLGGNSVQREFHRKSSKM